MKWATCIIFTALLTYNCIGQTKIDREAVLERNNPIVTSFDSLSSLTVGNGGFAFTVDATGLQSFPLHYSNGMPLGTMSDWGWHAFPDTSGHIMLETYAKSTRGKKTGLYCVEFPDSDRRHSAVEWFKMNPHRLHLGTIGFLFPDSITPDSITSVKQVLDLYSGVINSSFSFHGDSFIVKTLCHPDSDLIAVRVDSRQPLAIKINFPYPTGGFADDACNWNNYTDHNTSLVSYQPSMAILKHTIDATSYFLKVQWNGEASFYRDSTNSFVFAPNSGSYELSCYFYSEDNLDSHDILPSFDYCYKTNVKAWHDYWDKGGMIDCSECSDPRAKELERRVVLSQYLLAVQDAGDSPAQETGLTYNSSYGKFHLESQWWHQAHFALWGHPEKLTNTLEWYFKAEPAAKAIAARQNYIGTRWMSVTDVSARETPSSSGSYLIWQQPMLIYLAELLYQSNHSDETLNKYWNLVEGTADFMVSYLNYNNETGHYELLGCVPAQESIRFEETPNPALEIAAWRYSLSVAQQWRKRMKMEKIKLWDDIIENLAPLAYDENDNYLAAHNLYGSYTDAIYMTDHPAVLAVTGLFPASPLVEMQKMTSTLNTVWNGWHWNTARGSDYALTAMCAARVGNAKLAVDALLKEEQSNTYLINGHNYQNAVYRAYLPGNGGLLSAVSMMCAGWKGSKGSNPGFPNDGTWNIKWEGLKPLP